MKINITAKPLLQHKSDCVIVGVAANARALAGPAKMADDAFGGLVKRALQNGDFKAKPGDIATFFHSDGKANRRVILCGLGEEKIQPQNFLQAAEAGFAAAANSSKSALCLLSAESVGDRDAAWILGELSSRAAASAYKFKLGAKPDSSSLVQTDFYVDAAKDSSASIRAAIASGKAIANGIATARHLAELPPNICDPQYLANAARALARSHGITARILDEAKMRALKMNALLAVGDGSARRPRLIVMEHRGGGKSKPIVLVGKGITFDTGGISLKPSAAMDEMKFDMCGAASVFGAMRAVAEMNLPMNIVGIVAAAENMPDARACRPGDIITSMSGKTVEILNTDAEGRLVLADALTYAERYKPQTVVDIATLTGACVIALGSHASGLFSGKDSLADELLQAGESSGDRAWRLPLWDDYKRQLKSDYADIPNISGGRSGGAIIAACFLSSFAEKKYDWAHLDIAGTAWTEKKRATGRPVPLLCRFLINRAKGRRS